MELIFLSTLLFGFFLTGSAETDSSMVTTKKSYLLGMLARTKHAQADIKAFRDDDPAKFDYLLELGERTCFNMTERWNAAYQKIQELPEDGMKEEWTMVTAEVVQMDKQITNYYNNMTIEELKLRYLALAVLQCYKHDDRLPEASKLVEMVQASVLTREQIPETNPELSKTMLIEFFDSNRMVKIQKKELDLLNVVMAQWKIAKTRVNEAFMVVKASLPIYSDEGLNRALLNLAEYYRNKYRLWRFNEGVADVTRHIAAGDRKVDAILLPVKMAGNIHSEL